MGRPSAVLPHGTEMLDSSQIGCDGEDIRQVHGQRIATFSPNRNGGVGEVGEAMTSTRARAFSKSCLMSVRTFWPSDSRHRKAGAQNKSTKDDATLHFIPKATVAVSRYILSAYPLHEPEAVTHSVEPRRLELASAMATT